ncbi:Endonuclease/exonuclease/phosphatase [Sporodiniella umbellata]|nr:Endonuclease/exonuclease/phosphatase [Sporodiniella umbellata]
MTSMAYNKKPLSFMTLNVRHDNHANSPTNPFAPPPTLLNPFDPNAFLGEQPWTIRKWKVLDTITLYSPDILAVQECVHHQILDLEALLGEEYLWVGVGREDGDKKGEFCAVFYKRDVLKVESWKTIWLSETPEEVGSKSWDAKHSRIATQVLFRRIDNDGLFSVFNTHMDHLGSTSREESAKLVLERARKAHSEGPVFLIGDLNSTEDGGAYLTLTGSKYEKKSGQNDTLANLQELNETCASATARRTGVPVRTDDGCLSLPSHRVIRPHSVMNDLQEELYFEDASQELTTRIKSQGALGTLSGPYGHRDTFTSFKEGDNEAKRAPIRIDFIMTLSDRPVYVHHYATLSNQFDDGVHFSDHRPVLSRISWH